MDQLEFEAEDDWEILKGFLPEGWEAKAKELGALRRSRHFSNPSDLLRTLLIHLADGCSLRETVVRAREGNIVSVSDVALLKKLKASGEWLRWMAEGVMRNWIEKQPRLVFGVRRRFRVVDGSTVQEPGATGSTWKIHYSIGLFTLECDEVHVTDPKKGETFKRFSVEPGDVLLGDRGYAHRAGIEHVLDKGGDVLVRINLTNVPLCDKTGRAFPLLRRLRKLRGTKLADFDVWYDAPAGNGMRSGRLCAIRKSKAATEMAQKKLLRECKRTKRTPGKDTIEAAGYIMVFTTLDRDEFGPGRVLEMYRGRWQIELAFKRLKSIMALGHLKKTDIEGSKAWLHGKLLVAFLVEAFIVAGESFFPWGYPITRQIQEEQMSMAGD